MPDDLYTADIVRWSDQQAELLRRLARGERVNDAIDWENVIEEVESVGRSELSAVKSLLRHTLEHLLKLRGWPDSLSCEHWRGEVMTFLDDAADRWAPSMRQHIDLPALFVRARYNVGRQTIDGEPPLDLPQECPFSLDELLPPQGHDGASFQTLLARLAAASG